jgi:hypothetical protein
LSLGSLEVSNLTTPIIVQLPLPLGTSYSSGTLEKFQLNCSNETAIPVEVTSLDVARADYCGYTIGNSKGQEFGTPPGAQFTCSDASQTFDVQCENSTGAIGFNCPNWQTGGSCKFWDDASGSWRTDGCEYWYSDFETGITVCNCSHLTDFAGQEESLWEEQSSTFVSTTSSASDLTVQDVQDNIGILLVLVGVWTFFLVLYARDKLKHRRAVTRYLLETVRNEHLQKILDEIEQVLESQRPSQAVDEEGVQMTACAASVDRIDRMRAKSLVHTIQLERSGDMTTFLEVQASIECTLLERRKTFRNFWDSMKVDNDFVSMFFPGSWESSIATRRSIYILSKIITLTFVLCLTSPRKYLCPPEEEIERNILDDDLASNFVESPNFIQIQKEEGWNAMLWEVLWFMVAQFTDIFLTLLWTMPAQVLVYTDGVVGQLLDDTDMLQEERLLEQAHLAIIRPDSISVLKDAYVALEMLNTLKYVISRQLKVVMKKSMRKEIVEILSESKEQKATTSDVERIRQLLVTGEHAVVTILGQMRDRVRLLEHRAKQADQQELLQRVQGISTRREIRRLNKDFRAERATQRKQLEHEVAVSLMPNRLHVLTRQHDKVLESFDGRWGRKPMGRLSPLLIYIKKYLYTSYLIQDVGYLKTNMTRSQLVICKRLSVTIGLLYLLFCTFYVFLYAINLKDNGVVITILTEVALADGLEIFIIGPVEMFLAALIPAIMLSLIVVEVRKALGTEKTRRGSSTRHIETNVGDEMAANARRRIVTQVHPTGIEIEMSSNPLFPDSMANGPTIEVTALTEIDANEDDISLEPYYASVSPGSEERTGQATFTNPMFQYQRKSIPNNIMPAAEQSEDYKAWIETIIVDDEYDDI